MNTVHRLLFVLCALFSSLPHTPLSAFLGFESQYDRRREEWNELKKRLENARVIGGSSIMNALDAQVISNKGKDFKKRTYVKLHNILEAVQIGEKYLEPNDGIDVGNWDTIAEALDEVDELKNKAQKDEDGAVILDNTNALKFRIQKVQTEAENNVREMRKYLKIMQVQANDDDGKISDKLIKTAKDIEKKIGQFKNEKKWKTLERLKERKKDTFSELKKHKNFIRKRKINLKKFYEEIKNTHKEKLGNYAKIFLNELAGFINMMQTFDMERKEVEHHLDELLKPAGKKPSRFSMKKNSSYSSILGFHNHVVLPQLKELKDLEDRRKIALSYENNTNKKLTDKEVEKLEKLKKKQQQLYKDFEKGPGKSITFVLNLINSYPLIKKQKTQNNKNKLNELAQLVLSLEKDLGKTGKPNASDAHKAIYALKISHVLGQDAYEEDQAQKVEEEVDKVWEAQQEKEHQDLGLGQFDNKALEKRKDARQQINNREAWIAVRHNDSIPSNDEMRTQANKSSSANKARILRLLDEAESARLEGDNLYETVDEKNLKNTRRGRKMLTDSQLARQRSHRKRREAYDLLKNRTPTAHGPRTRDIAYDITKLRHTINNEDAPGTQETKNQILSHLNEAESFVKRSPQQARNLFDTAHRMYRREILNDRKDFDRITQDIESFNDSTERFAPHTLKEWDHMHTELDRHNASLREAGNSELSMGSWHKERRDGAATKMQKVFRGHQARREVARYKTDQQTFRDDSLNKPTDIQKWREMRSQYDAAGGDSEHDSMGEWDRRNKAATQMQSQWRGRKERIEYNKKRDAATRIQSVFRGNSDRERVKFRRDVASFENQTHAPQNIYEWRNMREQHESTPSFDRSVSMGKRDKQARYIQKNFTARLRERRKERKEREDDFDKEWSSRDTRHSAIDRNEIHRRYLRDGGDVAEFMDRQHIPRYKKNSGDGASVTSSVTTSTTVTHPDDIAVEFADGSGSGSGRSASARAHNSRAQPERRGYNLSRQEKKRRSRQLNKVEKKIRNGDTSRASDKDLRALADKYDARAEKEQNSDIRSLYQEISHAYKQGKDGTIRLPGYYEKLDQINGQKSGFTHEDGHAAAQWRGRHRR